MAGPELERDMLPVTADVGRKANAAHPFKVKPGWAAESQRAAVAPTVRKRGRPRRVPEKPVIDIYNPGFE